MNEIKEKVGNEYKTRRATYRRLITVGGVEYPVPNDITLREYVSSAGATAVDLGVVPVGTDDVTIRRRHKGTNVATSSYFGCMPASSQPMPRFSFGKYSNNGAKDFCGFNITLIVGAADTEWHNDRVYSNNGVYYVQQDDVTPVSYTPQVQTQPTLTAYLFARHGTSGVQVYDDEGTDIAFVDWKDANGVPKMAVMGATKNGVVGVYDFVSKTFIAPTVGTLTAGNALPNSQLYKYVGEIEKKVNGVYKEFSMGFPRTVSGSSPITLPDARAKVLTKNKIYGNTKRTITVEGIEYVIPDGITLLESITSDGNQYINTGVIPDNTTGFKVKMAVPEIMNDVFRFGCRQDSGATRFIIGTQTGAAYLGFGDTLSPSVVGSWAIYVNEPFVAQLNYLNDRHAYINDAISSTSSINDISETTFTYPLIMFGRNSSGSVSTSPQTIYSCVITRGTEIIRVFIPAKNSSNVVGMQDFVTGQFFTNAGTGTFTAGNAAPNPDMPLGAKGVGEKYININGEHYHVPSGITPLVSIDNNGTAYFDLGMSIGSSDVITFDIAWNSLINAPYFGAYNAGGAYNRNSFNGTYFGSGSKKGFYDNGLSISYFTPTIGVRKTLKWNGLNTRPTYDGVEFGATPINDITPSVNAYLGTRNQGGNAGSIDDFTLYGLKVERNNNVVSLMIGAKNSKNIVGIYDLVREIFIEPNVGSCTAGAEATVEYKVEELLAQNCGCVDMSTLNWNPIGNGCFYTAITGKANGRNIYCSKYPTDQVSMASATANMHIGGHEGNRVYFKNTTIEQTRAAAQNDLSGEYLYYQRTNDATWTPPTKATAYLDKDLQGNATIKDTFDFESGVDTDAWEFIVLDGVTAGHKVTDIASAMVSSRHYYGFYGISSSTAYKSFVGFISNYFKTSAASAWPSANANEIVSQGGQTSASVFLTIADTDTDRNTVAKLNAWFAERLAAGNPVWIGVPKATPSTTQKTAVNVTTAKGTNYLAVDGANIEATYIKKEYSAT